MKNREGVVNMALFDQESPCSDRLTFIKKALVTGANGFLGSAVCKKLAKKGVRVFALIRDKNSDVNELEHIDNVSVVYCDMCNYKMLPTIIAERDIDVLYHFAWRGSAGVRSRCR